MKSIGLLAPGLSPPPQNMTRSSKGLAHLTRLYMSSQYSDSYPLHFTSIGHMLIRPPPWTILPPSSRTPATRLMRLGLIKNTLAQTHPIWQTLNHARELTTTPVASARLDRSVITASDKEARATEIRDIRKAIWDEGTICTSVHNPSFAIRTDSDEAVINQTSVRR